MDAKQLCRIRDTSYPATHYYVIVLHIRERSYHRRRQVTTVTNLNKKIIDRLYKNNVTEK